MQNSEPKKMGRRPTSGEDEQPLLRLLVDEATRRGETLAALAGKLGVTYTRLAQWRRGEASITTAQPAVISAAAEYLGVPKVAVLALVGAIRAEDFIWPGREPLDARVRRELESMRRDPMLAGFIPQALTRADPQVQLFVTMLYREVRGGMSSDEWPFTWVLTLQRAAAGSARAWEELNGLRRRRAGVED